MTNKFYFILVTLIYTLTACQENTQEHHDITKATAQTFEKQELIENETTSNKIVLSKTKEAPLETSKTNKPIEKQTITIPVIEYHYHFEDLKKQENILDIKNDIYTFKNIKQPIVIMTIMATWCPPCRGQIPHLEKLQQKFKDNLFVMSMLVHDDISNQKLNKFIIAQKMLFYLSVTQKENLKFTKMLMPKLALSEDFPMPLTLVFVQGKYFTHYEGMIPEEMIESDIQQLVKKIKTQK